jgi:hypothetical protein
VVSKEDAIKLGEGWSATVYHGTARYASRGKQVGGPVQGRVNGKCKTWKTRPMEFRLPLKVGFRGFSEITEGNCHEWYLTEEEALKHNGNTDVSNQVD